MSDFIHGNTDVKPEDIGYSSQRLQLLADYVKGLVDNKKVQSAGFLMAREGKVFAHQTMGSLNYKADSPPFKPESIKGIASISKIVTSTAIMQLIENGSLWLEQSVGSIIEEFNTPMHGGIQIKHLLTHTAGIPADPGYFLEPYPYDDYHIFEKSDWIKRTLSGPLQSQPGEQWSYSSLGFTYLAEIVSRVSGMHFNDYVVEKIFKPLGMSRTFMEIPENLLSEVSLLCKEHEEWVLEENVPNETSAPDGGGGVKSTMADLFKLGQAYLNGGTYNGNRILSKTTCAAMTRNQLDGVPAFHWGKHLKNFRQGLGWGFFCDGSTLGPKVFNHEGWGWCALFVDPVEQFIYISMFENQGEWNPDLMVKPRTMAWSGIE